MSSLFGYRMSGISAASRGICIVAASLVSVFAGHAQEDEAEARQERVIVTGSIIPNYGNLVETSPVTSIGAPEFDARGVLRAEDIINTLPQAFGAQGVHLANSASGTASVNLRGLGSNRTLLLVNGRRLPYGSAQTSASDLNFVPSALVERVDVLTGGASAAYGSDAMSGVVNFILKDDFEGFRIDANYSFYQHDNSDSSIQALLQSHADVNPSQFTVPKGNVIDGVSIDANLIFGGQSEGGKGSFTGFFGYRKTDAVIQGSRDYGQCALGSADDKFVCRGSPTNQFSNIVSAAPSSSFLNIFPNSDTKNQAAVDPETGTFVERDGTSDTFNFNPYNHYLRPTEQYSFALFSEYEITPKMNASFDFMFNRNNTNARIAPSGVFGLGIQGDSGGINCNNVYLSDQQREILCGAGSYVMPPPPIAPEEPAAGASTEDLDAYQMALAAHQEGLAAYNANLPNLQMNFQDRLDALNDPSYLSPIIILRRNVEGGARNQDLSFANFLTRFGLQGEIPNSPLEYNASVSYALTTTTDVYNNDLSKRKIANALNAVADSDGNPVCAVNIDNDPTNNDSNCVPYDIWSGNPPDPDAVSYIATVLHSSGTVSQLNAIATISGSLEQYGVKLPAASDAVVAAVGVEYREDRLNYNPDEAYQIEDGAGQGGPQLVLIGNVNSSEIFAEIGIPIAQDLPFAHHLAIDLAYRYSQYNNSANTSNSSNTYKIGIDYAPTEDIRFRGSYQQAVRAPNIFELFSSQAIGLFEISAGDNDLHDPCAGSAPQGSAADCANSGVTALQYGNIADNPAGQFNALFGGNTELKPETAQTYTIGFVATPTAVPSLTLSLDYFNIEILDYVGAIDPEFVLNQCVDTGDTYFCSLVNRGPGGTLWLQSSGYIMATRLNTGSLSTSGFDLLVRYDLDAGRAGNFLFDYVGTLLNTLITKPLPDSPEDDIYDCVGYYGGPCGSPNPKYRHKISVTWSPVQGPFSVNGSWRYYGSTENAGLSSQVALNGTVPAIDSQLPVYNYFDLSGSYSPLENITLRLGVNNIFDTDPPLSPEGNNGNTFPQIYDPLGRYVFMSATVDF